MPPREPVLLPQLAMLAGLMPLRSIGADTFRVAHPTYDGRSVIIAILDSGLDPDVPGLRHTTTGDRKILDLRDFSGEGRVALAPVRAETDGSVTVGGQRLTGFGRVARVASPPYYGGVFHEVTLGAAPDGDLDGDGTITGAFPLIVARASSGWILVADTDGDGSLDNESPVHDYAVAGETFTFGSGPITLAANLSEEDRRPVLDLVMDNSSHGTHVAGIAAGHGLFGVAGFDGAAPGAWILGLKISNNARGGVSVTGSMLRALNYAADFANSRGLPLVVNLSFGVGNETEGAAAIDSLVDEFALRHPEALVVISAGNDGPGLSTVGFPGSADRALSVCALFPGVFARPPEPGVPPAPDVLGYWSGRGAEVAKPDVCAPGVAFSNVPRWRTGEEVSGGTSRAAPHASGAAALLLSAMRQQGRQVRAVDVKRALMATATPVAGATVLDAGAGIIDVAAAYRWLLAAHQTGIYEVRALAPGGTAATSAAYRREGLRFPGDTVQRFVIRSVAGQPAARLLLSSDARWLHAPPAVELQGRPETVSVRYDAFRLSDPGLYVGTVWARPASDTIAGPAFGLVNTIVVPHGLEGPFAERGSLAPGAMARHFFRVPEDGGGLDVRLEVSSAQQEGTLHLFEPDGQPFRGGSSASAGGQQGPEAWISVASDDLIPGVYEVVVAAAPAVPLDYTLFAELPAVTVDAVDAGPTATLRNRTQETAAVEVAAWWLGAVRGAAVTGRGSTPEVVRVRAPQWATRLVVDVALPPEQWHQLTDFGVTVFDSSGQRVSDAPLNYAFGRHEVTLDPALGGGALDVELFPGFAHLDPPATWTASLRIAFERPEGVPLEPWPAGGEPLVMPPGGIRVVRLPPLPAAAEFPTGYEALVEVQARAPAGPSGVRRGPAGAPRPEPGQAITP
jgi:subtilisin family serine protease